MTAWRMLSDVPSDTDIEELKAAVPKLCAALNIEITSDLDVELEPITAATFIMEALQRLYWRGVHTESVLTHEHPQSLQEYFLPPGPAEDYSGRAITQQDLEQFISGVFEDEMASSSCTSGAEPWTLYVLRCYENCWYVGIARDSDRRFLSHLLSSDGAMWTTLHRPLAAAHFSQLLHNADMTPNRDHYFTCQMNSFSAAKIAENNVTLQLMMKFGWRRVRGGDYTSIDEEHVRSQLAGRARGSQPTTAGKAVLGIPSPPPGAPPPDCASYVAKLKAKQLRKRRNRAARSIG